MSKKVVSRIVHGVRFSLASLALLQFSVLGPLVGSARAQEENHPQSPIKHVIVIVGENRSFDHIFATYKPQGNHQGRWDARPELLTCGAILS